MLLALVSMAIGQATLLMAGREPQVAHAGERTFVVCGDDDRLRIVASARDNDSFGTPVEIPVRGRLALGMRRGPRLAIAGRSLVVTAIVGERAGEGDLFAWRSVDEGRSWRGPVPVSDLAGAAREGLHATASSSKGRLACAWLDLRSKGTEIWVATSDDGGATWSKNVQAYRSPDGTVCECCHPSLAFGPRGELIVMFRNWLGGSRDMYVVRSPDGGRTFGPGEKLGRGTWPLNACPMDGGAVEIARDGTVMTTWRREGKVYTDRPGEPEVEIGEGAQPWIASGAVVLVEHDGTVVFRRGSARVALGTGHDPAVAVGPKGTRAVWSDDENRVWSAVLPLP